MTGNRFGEARLSASARPTHPWHLNVPMHVADSCNNEVPSEPEQDDPDVPLRFWDIVKSGVFTAQMRSAPPTSWKELMSRPGFALGLALEVFLNGIQLTSRDDHVALARAEGLGKQACILANKSILAWRAFNPGLPKPIPTEPLMDIEQQLLGYLHWCLEASQSQPQLAMPPWAVTSLNRLDRQLRMLGVVGSAADGYAHPRPPPAQSPSEAIQPSGSVGVEAEALSRKPARPRGRPRTGDPAQDKRIFDLRRSRNLTFDEIGAQLGMSGVDAKRAADRHRKRVQSQ